MNTDLKYLYRTAQLALLADNRVLDSPHVGSILVDNGVIIGEGYHRRAGSAHAEVNCLASVPHHLRHRIPEATLYVSLEPCCIVGKTGACSTLILNHGIRTVVIGQRDSTPGVDGGSVELLRAAGVAVREYPDFAPTRAAYRYRHTLVTEGRPHVTMKFAQSADGFLRPENREQKYWITNPISRRLVHRWRTGTTAVIVGARTVLDDDPRLDSRLYPGPNPIPVVIDPRGLLTGSERVFRGERPGILYTSQPDVSLTQGSVVAIGNDLTVATITAILHDLAERRLAAVTVEGGHAILQAFIKAGLWDEGRVFTGAAKFGAGLVAPRLEQSGGQIDETEKIGPDELTYYTKA